MPSGREVIDGGAEADGAGDVRRAGLELVRQLVVGGLLEGDRRDHVAAALVGRHRLEQGGLAVEHADAGRAVHLVPREGVEVAAERLHVHRHVRHAACAPSMRTGTPRRVGQARRSRATGLMVPSAFETCVTRRASSAGRAAPRNSSIIERAGIVDRRHAQPRALSLAEHLPRHDVRVVLHLGDEDLVARADGAAPERLRHQVDALGGAAREDDLAGLGAFRKRATVCRARLESRRGALAERVHAAVDVGVRRR
jgi:hypothetical protein